MSQIIARVNSMPLIVGYWDLFRMSLYLQRISRRQLLFLYFLILFTQIRLEILEQTIHSLLRYAMHIEYVFIIFCPIRCLNLRWPLPWPKSQCINTRAISVPEIIRSVIIDVMSKLIARRYCILVWITLSLNVQVFCIIVLAFSLMLRLHTSMSSSVRVGSVAAFVR